jgi:hypothetical protein
MSTFTAEASKKKWADESDSSDEEEEQEEQAAHKDEPVVAEDQEDSEEESESEDDADKLDLSKLKVTPAVEPKKEVKQLTKQEKKDLKQKELQDLDSLLAEFGAGETSAPAAAESSTAASGNNAAAATEDANKDKKKKKKKASGAKKDTPAAEGTADKEEETPFVPVANISAVLKSRTSGNKKGGSNSSGVTDAQKIALAEAKKASEGQKKKKNRDTSKFCEGTY